MIKTIFLFLLLSIQLITPSFADEFGDDYDMQESDVVEEPNVEDKDPLYTFNKGVYRVYKFSYNYAIKYVAITISSLPRYSKDRLRDFAYNAKEPTYMVNHFLQSRVNSGFESFFRFTLNSTIGIFGLWDVATYLGLPSKVNDFGATMYFYGVPSGPYLFLIGPSNVRDTIGLVPSYYAEGLYFPMYKTFEQLDIVYRDSSIVRISPSTLITLAFYSEYYRNNEQALSGFDEYTVVKAVFTNMRDQELQKISTYD